MLSLAGRTRFLRSSASSAFAPLSRPAVTVLVSTPSAHTDDKLQRRYMGTVEESTTATDAWKKSCYLEVNFTIPEENTVYEAVQRFAAFDIGCLVTTNAQGQISGVISERDYITKIALLGRTSKETPIKEISTKASNLVTATLHDPIEICMQKMITKDIRHLPLLDDDKNVVGMLSIKDCAKAALEEREKVIDALSNFALGRGGYFVED